MRTAGQWLLIVVLVLSTAGRLASPAAGAPLAAPAAQGTQLTLVSPTTCPSGGCAAGQRLNMRFEFKPINYDSTQNPNIKVCFYASSGWAVSSSSVTAATMGEMSGKEYKRPPDADLGCPQDSSPPAGYNLILERVTQLPDNTPTDALRFGFRLGQRATGSGQVVAHLFAYSASGWSQIQPATSSPTLPVIPTSNRVFVANDPATCGSTIPCYINSGDDIEGGIGTGLKDAVDAVPDKTTIYVMGNYTIKSRKVVVNKPLLLSGSADARITYSGSGACNNPMLSLTNEVTLRGLNINDGSSCTNPNRTLVEVDSSASAVTIERNDLTGGLNAIAITDNTADVRVRFNHISGNSGYGVIMMGSSKGAALEVTANNIYANGANPAIDCASGASSPVGNRKANHNYWGINSPTEDASHCTIDTGKRLGTPIVLESSSPGVHADVVTVTEDKTYPPSFEDKIAYNRSGGGDFPLYIIDHGYATTDGPPFSYALGGESPSPCSNYWDIFLPDNVTPSGALDLYFKYDQTTACLTTIKSSQYCGQTTTVSKFPLYWYDPYSTSNKWITTGSQVDSDTESQLTSCDTTQNEIHVTLDNTGRPNLSSDLHYLPFLVGVPVIKTFQPLASSQTITVSWSTNNEPDVTGFYVLRGQPNGTLSPITNLIPHTGSALFGRTYAYRDEGLENGVQYSYRLQVLRSDGTSIYSKIVTLAANQATITPTLTPRPTFTPRPTNTPAPTLVPPIYPTRNSTATKTLLIPTQSPTVLLLPTRTATVDMNLPGAAFTVTALAQTAQVLLRTGTSTFVPYGTPDLTQIALSSTYSVSGTPIAMLLSKTPASATAAPSPTGSPVPTGTVAGVSGSSGANPWLSLMLGLLAGIVLAGVSGGLWYLLRIKQ